MPVHACHIRGGFEHTRTAEKDVGADWKCVDISYPYLLQNIQVEPRQYAVAILSHHVPYVLRHFVPGLNQGAMAYCQLSMQSRPHS